jgi:hypothetical protein
MRWCTAACVIVLFLCYAFHVQREQWTTDADFEHDFGPLPELVEMHGRTEDQLVDVNDEPEPGL